VTRIAIPSGGACATCADVLTSLRHQAVIFGLPSSCWIVGAWLTCDLCGGATWAVMAGGAPVVVVVWPDCQAGSRAECCGPIELRRVDAKQSRITDPVDQHSLIRHRKLRAEVARWTVGAGSGAQLRVRTTLAWSRVNGAASFWALVAGRAELALCRHIAEVVVRSHTAGTRTDRRLSAELA
jgi:hypothetical protein